MAVEVKRKQSESAEALIRRFRRRVLQSGVINRVKSLRFRTKKRSPLTKKISALRRLTDRRKREFLIKIGMLK